MGTYTWEVKLAGSYTLSGSPLLTFENPVQTLPSKRPVERAADEIRLKWGLVFESQEH